MLSSRTGLSRRSSGRRWSVRAGLAVLGLVASTGCQVEYAGMTLPSGKYMQDDVQYFPPGPEFPFANTQAATQRARMQAMGMPVPPLPGTGIGPDGNPMAPGGTGAPGGGIPRLNAAPEAENAMPGGPSAPATTPPAPAQSGPPGGSITPPPGP